ncbi:hypothetical protein [Anabaena sp. UHCC 0451]|uniref:hypothetical protein n=1 Tax=Anabaena sp. UHCC 0451 TaxID=2055235 RepID=UPI002B1F3A54|nr:hypothetical protein [Anabaena sp. UHCC 0451]MEA5576696.1 hypothetical protein [Anabaena sp. UHCC 0451]
MNSIYPTSTSSHPTIWQASWKFAAMEVDYLFIGMSSRYGRERAEGNNDFRYVCLNVLNSKPQIETSSGRYKRNVVLQ